MITGQTLLLWILSLLPLGQASTLQQLGKRCQAGEHVWCIRKGVELLQQGKLNNAQQTQVYTYLANAYLSIGRLRGAALSIKEMIRSDPCRFSSPPKGFHPRGRRLFVKLRKEVMQEDSGPPVVTHLTPSAQNLRQTGKIFAKVTDDLGLRSVTLAYRFRKKGDFATVPFRQVAPHRYEARLPSALLKKAPVFHYYIRVYECASNRPVLFGNPQNPVEILLRSEPVSGRVLGGGLLLGLGGALVVGSSLFFYTTYNELDLWHKTEDLDRAETIRQGVLLYHALGWSLLGLGVVSAGIGVYLLLIQPYLESNKNRQPALPTDEASPLGQALFPPLGSSSCRPLALSPPEASAR